ncbi:MAG: YegS/Rv2252/BmrU family lipid kinase [Lachnospiraceae bacterium]|nr:YegS/Rv2252/BmrU family lipid kinase [Lachnospiraceae bacterium]
MHYFLVNLSSASGMSKHIWNDIEKYLKEKGCDYKLYVTEYENHATEIVRQIENECKEEKIKLVVIGGDGTFNEVINAVSDFKRFSFGLIPAGSGNDLARGLGISKNHMENIKNIFENDKTRYCDAGRIVFPDEKCKMFAISCGMGLDAEVCYFAITSKIKTILNKFKIGSFTYIVLTVLRLFSMRTVDAKIRFDDKVYEFKDMIFTAGMNHKCEGGGVPMAPGADYNDGKLDFTTANNISRPRALFSLGFLSAGKAEHIKGICTNTFKKADIILAKPMIFHTDGEYVGTYDKASVTCCKDLLEFIN